MSEANGTFPTMVTGKRKRGSGFIFSTKKALEHSRLSKKSTKGRVLEFTSVTKALTYPSALWSDIGVVTSEIAQLDQLGLHSFTQLMKTKRRGLM
jgi:hypothetical protein